MWKEARFEVLGGVPGGGFLWGGGGCGLAGCPCTFRSLSESLFASEDKNMEYIIYLSIWGGYLFKNIVFQSHFGIHRERTRWTPNAQTNASSRASSLASPFFTVSRVREGAGCRRESRDIWG